MTDDLLHSFAFNLETDEVDSTTTFASARMVKTAGDRVWIFFNANQMALWTFKRGTVTLDTDGIRSRLEPAPFPEYFEVLFHPLLDDVTFILGEDTTDHRLNVFEFKGSTCTNMYVNTGFGSRGPCETCGAPVTSKGGIQPRQFNPYGEYALLAGDHRCTCIPAKDPSRVLSLMCFNVLSKTFSVFDFPQCPRAGGNRGSMFTCWDGQLVSHIARYDILQALKSSESHNANPHGIQTCVLVVGKLPSSENSGQPVPPVYIAEGYDPEQPSVLRRKSLQPSLGQKGGDMSTREDQTHAAISWPTARGFQIKFYLAIGNILEDTPDDLSLPEFQLGAKTWADGDFIVTHIGSFVHIWSFSSEIPTLPLPSQLDVGGDPLGLSGLGLSSGSGLPGSLFPPGSFPDAPHNFEQTINAMLALVSSSVAQRRL